MECCWSAARPWQSTLSVLYFRDIAEIGRPVESGRGHLTLEWFRVGPSTRLLRIHPAECSTALEDSAAEQRHPRDDEGASAAYRPDHRA